MRHSAGIVLFDKTDETYLILKANNTDNLWSFPKGEIESGESPLLAALRELKEETGIEFSLEFVSLVDIEEIGCQTYKTKKKKVTLFKIELDFKPEVMLNWENIQYQWVKFEDLKRLHEAQFKLVEKLGCTLY